MVLTKPNGIAQLITEPPPTSSSILSKKEYTYIYGRKSVDRIATQSMSKICNLWRLIVLDCDYAESYGRFLSGGNADASHVVYIVPDDS